MFRDFLSGERSILDADGGDVLQSLLSVLKARRDLARLDCTIHGRSKPQEGVSVKQAMPGVVRRSVEPWPTRAGWCTEKCEASGDVELRLLT